MTSRLTSSSVPVVTALVLALTAAGCTGTDSDSSDPATASTPAPRDEVAQSVGLAKIDIAGPDGSPITWQVPAGTTADSPVGVTQRFLALYGQAGTPGTDPDMTLVSSVTSDEEYPISAEGATTRNKIRAGHIEADTPSGPLWVWLDTAQENGDHAVVRGCADVGYFQPRGVTTPAKDRAVAWYTELRRVEDFDGKDVWKVSRHNGGPIRESNEFEAQCPGWATHAP